MGNFWGLESVVSPSLSNYGGTRLDPIRGHVDILARPREPGVHDGGGARMLSRARGSHIPHDGRGICDGFLGVL
jgi:hypothetical protein